MTSNGQRFRRRAVRRGYKVDEVDAFLERVEATLAGGPVEAPVTAQEVRDVVFRVRFGGYDEWQVDLHLDRVERQLAEMAERSPAYGHVPDPRGPGQPAPAPAPVPRPSPVPGGVMGSVRPDPVPPAPRYDEPTLAGGFHRSETFHQDMTTEMHMGDPGGRPWSPAGPSAPPGMPDQSGMPGPSGHGGPPGWPGPSGSAPSGPGGPSGAPGPGLPRRVPERSGMSGQPYGAGGPPHGPGGPPHGPGGQPGGMGGPPTFGGPAPGTPPTLGGFPGGPPPGAGGPPAAGVPAGDLQRVDELRRAFQPRRFGSGYDRAQVDQLFDEVLAGMSGQVPMSVNESHLDPRRFDLVPGGYYEADVDNALHEVREMLRRH